MLSIRQIVFCAEECDRQKSGELSVGRMAAAFDWLLVNKPKLTVENVIYLAAVIDHRNMDGFRTVPVYFEDLTKQAIPFTQIPQAMKSLFEWTNTPDIFLDNRNIDRFIQEFLDIHPFIDGNGRTASLLYVYIDGRMDNPLRGPDYVAK